MNTTDVARRTEEAESAGWSPGRQVHVYALALWFASLLLFRQELVDLARLSFIDENSSHVLLIPLISALLIFWQRETIFRTPRLSPAIGGCLLLAAVLVWYGLQKAFSRMSHTDYVSATAVLIILVWIGGFILFYGTSTFKAALFPMLFLSLMIPVPAALGKSFASVLQKGSAETCGVLFRLIGVPIVQHGFRISLPQVDIEVAENCSGIHSALALFIAGLLMQHILLRGGWRKAFFVLCVVPIAIFKNAVRIVTISWLGIHVDAGFFQGQLHRKGGLPFSFLAMALLGLLTWLLRRPSFLSGDRVS